jgi:hypothetical protein
MYVGRETAMTELKPNPLDAPVLDDRIRGVPPGTSAFPASDIGARWWRLGPKRKPGTHSG